MKATAHDPTGRRKLCGGACTIGSDSSARFGFTEIALRNRSTMSKPRASCVCSSRRLAAQPMIDASEARLEHPSCEHRPLNFRGA
jgi:hypothetical protein